MTALPRALEPWRSSLEPLAPELVGGLAPMVQRLSLAIGPYRAPSRPGAGEPDGYDGLARRGLYERLLASEWLLASELPEEFLRRASSGEHAFLQLAQRVPAGGRRSLALFDTGPSQLGTPRIAHLAALIVLYHRAQQAGVAFAWGILQLPEAALIENVSEASVLSLLAARTVEEAAETHLAAWRDRLDDEELWTVGARSWAERSITVEDVLDPAVRQVAVEVRRSRILLDLPSDADSTRLMRDPYRVMVAPPREHPLPAAPFGNPQFSTDGKRVIVCLKDGKVAILAIPTSARMTPGRAGIFEPPKNEVVIAAGGRPGQVWLATVDVSERSIRFYRVGKRGGVAGRSRVGPLAGSMQPLPALGPLAPLVVSGDIEFAFSDGHGQLLQASNGEVSYAMAAALTLDAQRPLWVDGANWAEKRRRFCQPVEGWSAQRLGPELGAEGPSQAFFAGDVTRSQLIAAVRQNDAWAMVRLHRAEPYVEATLHPSGHAEVVGALLHPPSLVLLDEGRHSLSVVSRNLSRILVQSSRKILHVTVSQRGTHVAWVDEACALTVMAIGTQEIVLRLEGP